jgi:hypothetical protein
LLQNQVQTHFFFSGACCFYYYYYTRGFKRFSGKTVPPNCIAYRHAAFKRDQPELLKAMQSGSNRHHMISVEAVPTTTTAATRNSNTNANGIAASLSQQRNHLLQQHMLAVATSNNSSTGNSGQNNRHSSSSSSSGAPGLQQHDASSALIMGMGGGLFGGGAGGIQAQSQMMDAMYFNTASFGHPGMFGPGAGGLASSSSLQAAAAATQPLGPDAISSEPSSDVLQRLMSQQTRSFAAAASSGDNADQAFAYEQMVANQRASNLEAEFRLQQRWNPQQHNSSNYYNYNNMGPGGNGDVGLTGMPGGMPTDNPENTELVRLLLMRDQLDRKKNGEL